MRYPDKEYWLIEATHKDGLYLRPYTKLEHVGAERWGKWDEAALFLHEKSAHIEATRKGLKPEAYRVTNLVDAKKRRSG